MARVWFVTFVALAVAIGCSAPPIETLKLDGNVLTVDNRTGQDWRDVEIWLNTYYRIRTDSIPSNGRFNTSLDNFVAGYGQRFQFKKQQIRDLRLTAKQPDGKAVEIKKDFVVGGLDALKPRT